MFLNAHAMHFIYSITFWGIKSWCKLHWSWNLQCMNSFGEVGYLHLECLIQFAIRYFASLRMNIVLLIRYFAFCMISDHTEFTTERKSNRIKKFRREKKQERSRKKENCTQIIDMQFFPSGFSSYIVSFSLLI